MSAMLLAQQILNGLLDGVYYLLIALGLSLIFSLGGIVNLAHGAFYAIGAYLTLVFSPYIGFGGSFVAAPVAVALFGVVIERTLFRRFYRSDPILSLLLTFGLAMVAEQVLRMIFGAPPLSYSIPPWLRGQVAIGSFIYSFYRVVLLGIAAACIGGLWLLLQKTSFGRVVRAGVQNPDMVGALGISLQPYMSAVAALGIGLAGLAGVLLAPIYSIHPAMGQEIITPAFVVVVIGGLGSFWGVVAAALLVGLVKGVMVGIGYSAADRRTRPIGAAAGAARARPHHDLRYRSRHLRLGLHGAQHSGRAYRPRLVRPRRLVRSCGLRRRAAAAQLDARFVFRTRRCRRSDRGSGCRGVRIPDPETAWRVFLAIDAGAGGDALCGVISLDGSHRRRKRHRRHHAADAVRPQPGILDRLLLVCRGHRIPDADAVIAFP